MKKYLLFLSLYFLLIHAIPFPTDIIDDTIHLRKGETYEITESVIWRDNERVIIMGNGAEITVNNVTGTVFSMKGSKWILDSVRVIGNGFAKLFELNVTSNFGFLQIRSCYWSCDADTDITVNGRLSHFVLQNSLFENNRQHPHFFSTSQNVAKYIWNNNVWNGNYSISLYGDVHEIQFERNTWKQAHVSAEIANNGSFYHPEDGNLCNPPDKDMETQYVACTNKWFLDALNQGKSRIKYSVPENIEGDVEIPDTWIFDRSHEIDWNGFSWETTSVTVHSNVKLIAKNHIGTWKSVHFFVMKNASVEISDSTITDSNMEIAIITDSSHFFFELCNIEKSQIIGTGIGHVHVQDTNMKDFMVTAPSMWASGNILSDGRIVTQSYMGHIQYSYLKNVKYFLSPFYLGNEPISRMQFIRNKWEGDSDLIIPHSLSNPISVTGDIIIPHDLARKMTLSPKIRGNGLIDGNDRPLLANPPKGHVWAHGETPQKCPDGFHPGGKDEMGIPVNCVTCDRPERSSDGICDNLRKMDLIPDDLSLVLGSARAYLPETSYYRFIAGDRIRTDCYSCAALCLGIDPSELDYVQFTLPQLLNNTTHTEYCSKCALYCADVSGCASYCMTFETILIIIIVGLLCIGLPFFCFASICLRARTVRVKVHNLIGDKICVQCGKNVAKKDIFCYNCGTPQKIRFQEPVAPLNRDINGQDPASLLKNAASFLNSNN